MTGNNLNPNEDSIFQTVNNWLETSGRKRDPNMFPLVKNLILEELEELELAVIAKDPQEQRDAIVDLIWVVLNWDYANNLNSEEHATAVAKANWSKFCTTEDEAIQTVDAYIRGVHPSKPGAKIDCYYVQSNDYWVVRRLSDDKILKSINFKAP